MESMTMPSSSISTLTAQTLMILLHSTLVQYIYIYVFALSLTLSLSLAFHRTPLSTRAVLICGYSMASFAGPKPFPEFISQVGPRKFVRPARGGGQTGSHIGAQLSHPLASGRRQRWLYIPMDVRITTEPERVRHLPLFKHRKHSLKWTRSTPCGKSLSSNYKPVVNSTSMIPGSITLVIPVMTLR